MRVAPFFFFVLFYFYRSLFRMPDSILPPFFLGPLQEFPSSKLLESFPPLKESVAMLKLGGTSFTAPFVPFFWLMVLLFFSPYVSFIF